MVGGVFKAEGEGWMTWVRALTCWSISLYILCAAGSVRGVVILKFMLVHMLIYIPEDNRLHSDLKLERYNCTRYQDTILEKSEVQRARLY